jgi:hypothetical protein
MKSSIYPVWYIYINALNRLCLLYINLESLMFDMTNYYFSIFLLKIIFLYFYLIGW